MIHNKKECKFLLKWVHISKYLSKWCLGIWIWVAMFNHRTLDLVFKTKRQCPSKTNLLLEVSIKTLCKTSNHSQCMATCNRTRRALDQTTTIALIAITPKTTRKLKWIHPHLSLLKCHQDLQKVVLVQHSPMIQLKASKISSKSIRMLNRTLWCLRIYSNSTPSLL